MPLKNKVERLDNTTSYNRVKISDISVNDTYITYNEDGYKVIQIGDADQTIVGEKNYEISYLYNLGKDTGKDYDELYFNLIGEEWDTIISNITFTITMPKEFDENKLGFASGVVGSTENNVTYNVNGNVITGQLNGYLKPGEALTVRLELPEGYFVGASSNIDYSAIINIIIPLIFLVVVFIIWLVIGKDNKVIETVEFYPPEGFNSAEIGFLYKGYVDSNDVVSLLIYLANKGYIKIEETENSFVSSLFTSRYKIIKVKDYDGVNSNEQIFLDGLFSCKGKVELSFNELIDYAKNPKKEILEKKKTNSEVVSVTEKDLYDEFYLTINKIIEKIGSKENKEKIFEKKSLKMGLPIILMIIIIFILITYKPFSEYGEDGSMLLAILFPGIGFSFLLDSIAGLTENVNNNFFNKIFSLVFGLIWGGLFGGIVWATMVLPALLVDPIYLIVYIVGLIVVFFLLILYKHMPKRTPYGNAILGKILGFRNFLETVEKPQLEQLVMQNPIYFYDILPYTYVFEISNKWIKKFESIALQAPDWYVSKNAFNPHTFEKFMTTTMSSASAAAKSSSGSSGGSSGGGSSGGGSGGGGGGSW